MDIGKKIKMLREQRGMTQSELAKYIKSTKQTIFKYESGIVTNIPMDKLVTIARVLDCSPAYLLGWENNNLGVNNGIIGNHNHSNVIYNESSGEIEMELIALCKKMSLQQKIKLITFAYSLTEESNNE